MKTFNEVEMNFLKSTRFQAPLKNIRIIKERNSRPRIIVKSFHTWIDNSLVSTPLTVSILFFKG